MEVFKNFLENIENLENRKITSQVLTWINKTYPNLKPEIKWNQPMFTDHGTFIAAFSVAKKHLAFAPEKQAVDFFKEEIIKAGYDCGIAFIRMPWNKSINFELLKNIIEYNIVDKANHKAFWRV